MTSHVTFMCRETLQLQTLHYIIQLIANYYETMVMEKRSLADARLWAQRSLHSTLMILIHLYTTNVPFCIFYLPHLHSTFISPLTLSSLSLSLSLSLSHTHTHTHTHTHRLHYAIQAYKELLLYVQQMCLSKDTNLHDSAKVIQSNIFYHSEYRDVFVTLLRNFYEVFQTRSCLRDIIESAHVYFRQMERYSSENSHMIVQERRTGKGRGKKKKKGQGALHYNVWY